VSQRPHTYLPTLGQIDLHNRDEYGASPGCEDMVFLATDLIELVPLDPDNEVHVEVYRQSRNEPEMRATGSYGKCDTPSHTHERINEGHSTENPSALCAIRAEGTVVGWAVTNLHDLRAHAAYVGYYVLPDYWGNGYASEAAQLLVAYAFDELNAHRVEASVQADNPASKRVLEKLGFQQEGTKRDAYYKQGEYKDITLWSLLDDEFGE
jgi:RimJ/RimL family protein N-acetyltransferase